MRIGRKKSEVFHPLKDRVRQKLHGWREKSISKAGKLVLLKTAAQTVLNFWMNPFLFPEELCDDIEKLMNSFWWSNGSTDGKGVKWMSWKRLCMGGGLGMKELHKFNVSMLAKQRWRLLNNDNPPSYKVDVGQILSKWRVPNCYTGAKSELYKEKYSGSTGFGQERC